MSRSKKPLITNPIQHLQSNKESENPKVTGVSTNRTRTLSGAKNPEEEEKPKTQKNFTLFVRSGHIWRFKTKKNYSFSLDLYGFEDLRSKKTLSFHSIWTLSTKTIERRCDAAMKICWWWKSVMGILFSSLGWSLLMVVMGFLCSFSTTSRGCSGGGERR